MKLKLFTAAVALAALLTGGMLIAADKEFKATCPVSGGPAKEANAVAYHGNKQLAQTDQITQVCCPISGRPVDAEQHTDVDGVSVAFCCKNCKAKAEAAENAVALLFGDLEKGFTLQTVCPISGKKINIEKVVEHDGKKVYFCCGGCPDAFKADPSKYTAKLPQFSTAK
jgi:YHS domain-containing protein